MQKLEAGIHHFQANYFASNRRLFEDLAKAGQRPETLFITCSDSRVVPNLITNTAPGELFIIRNVGNIVPVVGGPIGGVTAAIEYAVEVLNINNVIVCGHTNCGAIDAILHPETVAHLPAVSRWIDESSRFFQENFDKRYGNLAPEARMTAAVQENVLVQLENLRTVECVARKLAAGTLKMNGWVFTIATGEVYDYDPVSGQFLKVGGDERERSVLSSRPPSI